VGGLYARFAAFLKKELQAFVAERLNHARLYRVSLRIANTRLCRFKRNHFTANTQLIQVISSALHHGCACGPVGGAVVGASIRVTHGVGWLVFYQVNPFA
jgi:hypothetical protein